MSHIINSKKELELLREKLELIEKYGLTYDTISSMFELIIPKDSKGNNLVNYSINNGGFQTAYYVPSSNTIKISLNKSEYWLNKNTQGLMNLYDVSNKKLFKNYMLLFLIAHEIEHAYQSLFANKVIEIDSCISDSYKLILDNLFKKDSYIIPRPATQLLKFITRLNYKMHDVFYVLERNANVEASDLLTDLAIISQENDVANTFSDMKYNFTKIGYLDDNLGPFYHTSKDLLILSKFKKINCDNTLSIDNKIRYGFEISENEREKVFVKK